MFRLFHLNQVCSLLSIILFSQTKLLIWKIFSTIHLKFSSKTRHESLKIDWSFLYLYVRYQIISLVFRCRYYYYLTSYIHNNDVIKFPLLEIPICSSSCHYQQNNATVFILVSILFYIVGNPWWLTMTNESERSEVEVHSGN